MVIVCNVAILVHFGSPYLTCWTNLHNVDLRAHVYNVILEHTCTYIPAEKGWKSQYEMTEKHCIHGAYCKNRESCLSKRKPVGQ